MTALRANCPSVLVIEDDIGTRNRIARLLKKNRCNVVAVGSAAEGVMADRATRFDLYLTGKRISNGAGLGLCYRLHCLHPDTPILAILDETQPSRHNLSGIRDHITKLAETDDLPGTVARLVRGSRAARARAWGRLLIKQMLHPYEPE
jgi:DNA-binding NtrC family response regulator